MLGAPTHDEEVDISGLGAGVPTVGDPLRRMNLCGGSDSQIV